MRGYSRRGWSTTKETLNARFDAKPTAVDFFHDRICGPLHGTTEVVSRRVEGDIHRTTWAAVRQRAKQLAQALDALGLPQGARVASIAWNGYRHLEMYYGVSGSGRVLHTINPRLHFEQVAWIVNHAEDEVL